MVHLAGEADVARMQTLYDQAGVSAEVHGFITDMAPIYDQADIALCRSGATTVSECRVAGLGAIYVPLPWAAEDHQTANARAVARGGGAVVLPQSADQWSVPHPFAEALLPRIKHRASTLVPKQQPKPITMPRRRLPA